MRRGGHFTSTKEDVAKAFPSVWLAVAARILRRLGLPEPFVRFVLDFYAHVVHWFEVGGACAAQGVAPLRGILQGCPVSCLLMSALMSCWVHALAEVPDLSVAVFVDDRIASTPSAHPERVLRRASLLSGRVDRALGLKRHPGKRAVASTAKADRRRLKKQAGLRGPPAAHLLILGVDQPYGKGARKAFSTERVAKFHRRLKRIRWAGRHSSFKRALVRQLVLPRRGVGRGHRAFRRSSTP
jgi:Reverse transcriptase (RNA-dependent DNA polymerase).